jgi:hypothetical protein
LNLIGYAVVSLKKYDDLSYLLEDIILALSRFFESSKGAVIVENSNYRETVINITENACAFFGNCWLKSSWLYNISKIYRKRKFY